MSCSARLPVYTLFTAIFFPVHGGIVLFGLYFGGIILAIISGLMFKSTILKGTPATFVMELPPYHLPTFRGIMFHTWKRLSDFILRAGKVIMIMVVILSLFNFIGTDGSFSSNNSNKSLLSASGKAITPILAPMGITHDKWPAAVGLFSGVFAEESIVGTLDTLYSQIEVQKKVNTAQNRQPENGFSFWDGIADAFKAIPAGFSRKTSTDTTTSASENITENSLIHYFDGQVGALAYLIFILIYSPCLAAITAIYNETNAKWATFSVLYLTGLAWLVSTIVYQAGTFFKHPATSAMWLAICSMCIAGFYGGLHFISREKR